jgi:hypothetical protein
MLLIITSTVFVLALAFSIALLHEVGLRTIGNSATSDRTATLQMWLTAIFWGVFYYLTH